MNLLITICGRRGSKGVKNKNIRPINEQPLIAYSIHAAEEFAKKHNADITLSTDSKNITNVAAEYGLKTTYTRPDYLATDTVGKVDVIRDIVEYEEKERNKSYDYILDLDITSPLRTQQDLEEAFEQIKSNSEALNLFSVSGANRNPYFNMVEATKDGFCKLIKDGSVFFSRQASPEVFDINGSFYFYRRAFFTEGFKTVITDKTMYYKVNHICFDIDEELDYTIMSFLIENNKLDFKF